MSAGYATLQQAIQLVLSFPLQLQGAILAVFEELLRVGGVGGHHAVTMRTAARWKHALLAGQVQALRVVR